MALEVAQDAVIALWHAEATKQPFGRATAGGMAEEPDQFRRANRLPRARGRRRRAPAGEGSALAGRIAAAPPGCSQVHLDGFALHRQSLKASHVGAVATQPTQDRSQGNLFAQRAPL